MGGGQGGDPHGGPQAYQTAAQNSTCDVSSKVPPLGEAGTATTRTGRRGGGHRRDDHRHDGGDDTEGWPWRLAANPRPQRDHGLYAGSASLEATTTIPTRPVQIRQDLATTFSAQHQQVRRQCGPQTGCSPRPSGQGGPTGSRIQWPTHGLSFFNSNREQRPIISAYCNGLELKGLTPVTSTTSWIPSGRAK
jgi:hypothetical protein